MSHRHARFVLGLFAALLAVGVPLSAFAQAVDVEAVEPERQDRTGFAFRTGYDHMFQTDVNSGGNVSRDSFQASIGGRWGVADKVHFTPRFIYELNAFDMSSGVTETNTTGSTLGWGNINQYTLVGIADWAITENWALLGGPIFRLAGEGSAPFDNGFTGGGLLGFNYKSGEDLSVGLAIGVISQLEDDPALIPIPMVRWHFVEPLTLKLGIDQLGGRTGLGPELIWHLTKELDFGVGAQYQRRRYRLDDHGTNRKGIGEDSGAPFFARLGFKPMEAALVEVFAGVVAAGELKVQNKNGDQTNDKGFDATPTIGLRGEFRF